MRLITQGISISGKMGVGTNGKGKEDGKYIKVEEDDGQACGQVD